MRQRPGMALAVTIGVVSLIAILAVATLSLAGRMTQQASLGLSDARLDGAVAYGLAVASDEWRSRGFGRLAVGSSAGFMARVPEVPVAVAVTVTRVSQELYWVVAESGGAGQAARREGVVVRVRAPDAAAIMSEDSTDVASLSFIAVDSLAASASVQLPPGATVTSVDGVVHVGGDATIPGGEGEGILIVDGRLAVTGPFSFTGILVARGGISVASQGVAVKGLIRASGDPPIAGVVAYDRAAVVVQDVLVKSLTPRHVAGRRWAELY